MRNAAFIILLSIAGAGPQACKAPLSAVEVESAYTGELAACAASAKSKADSKQCRKDVSARYGLCESVEPSGPRVVPCKD